MDRKQSSPKRSSSRQNPKKRNREYRKVDVPVLNADNFFQWEKKMIANFKAYRLYYYIENDVKMKDIKNAQKPWYKSAVRKVTKLLLLSTDGEDHQLIKEKSNEDIGTAWFAIIQKYEEKKTEIALRTMDKLMSIRPKKGADEVFLKKTLDLSRSLVMSVNAIDDFVLILMMCKLNNLYPRRYKSIEEYMKENLEKLTIDEFEKKNFEIERTEMEKRMQADLEANLENVEGSQETLNKDMAAQLSVLKNLVSNDDNQPDIKLKVNKSDSSIKLLAAKESNLMKRSYKSNLGKSIKSIRSLKTKSNDSYVDFESTSLPVVNQPTENSQAAEFQLEMNEPTINTTVDLPKEKSSKSWDSLRVKLYQTDKFEMSEDEQQKKTKSLSSATEEVKNKATKDETTSLDFSDKTKIDSTTTMSGLLSSSKANNNKIADPSSSTAIRPNSSNMDQSVTSNINQPVSNVNQPSSNVIQSSSNTIQPGSNVNQPISNITQAGSYVDQTSKVDQSFVVPHSTKESAPASVISERDSVRPSDSDVYNKTDSLKLTKNSSSARIMDLEDKLKLKFKDDLNLTADANSVEMTSKDDNSLISQIPTNKTVRSFNTRAANLNIGVDKLSDSRRIELGEGITPPRTPTPSPITSPRTTSPIEKDTTRYASGPFEPKKQSSLLLSKQQSHTSHPGTNLKVDSLVLQNTNDLKTTNLPNVRFKQENENENPFFTISNLKEYRHINLPLNETRPSMVMSSKIKLEPKRDANFFLPKLPINALKNIFFQLREADIINFIKLSRACYVLMNDILRSSIIVNQNFRSNMPFFMNLFHTNEHANYRNVLREMRIFNLRLRNYTDIMNQVRKVITNEIHQLNQFPMVEHLEIIKPTSETIAKYLSKDFTINLNQLKVLNLTIEDDHKYFINGTIIVNCPNLTTIKLVNMTDIQFSNPDMITYCDIDVYDKLVTKFSKLTHLYCDNFIDYKQGLFKSVRDLKELRLAHAYERNLINVFDKKKKFGLRFQVYVQGIKVDGPHQTIIIQDVTTFFGEMRIYLKYIKRLDNLDFLVELNVNFDVQVLRPEILRKLRNLENLIINFQVENSSKWAQLLSASPVLQSLVLSQPIEQIYLDMIPQICRNCIRLSIEFNSNFNFAFLSRINNLCYFHAKLNLTTAQISLIFHYKLKIILKYKDRELTRDYPTFLAQLRNAESWNEFCKEMK